MAGNLHRRRMLKFMPADFNAALEWHDDRAASGVFGARVSREAFQPIRPARGGVRTKREQFLDTALGSWHIRR
ncbi:MAG TPA: hypothetical protein VFE63_22210 [Roseiarcus sp.]|nr:hypothetical protein [Roseiarcus sp.]